MLHEYSKELKDKVRKELIELLKMIQPHRDQYRESLPLTLFRLPLFILGIVKSNALPSLLGQGKATIALQLPSSMP